MGMREEFEAWCESELNLRTIRLGTGDYQSFGADMAWRAYQASRAALVIELPRVCASDDPFELKRDIICELTDAGVSYK